MSFTLAMSVRRLCLLASLVCIVPRGAEAQVDLDSPYRFLETSQGTGPFAGYLATSDGSIGLGPSSAPVFGGRYGIRVSGPFMVEAELAYIPSTRAVLDTVPSDTAIVSLGETDMPLALARAALRFNVTGARTWHRLQPFALFGIGVALDLAGESSLDEELPEDVRFDFGTSFAADFGAGIEWFVSRRATLRLDARNLLWRLETPTAFLLGDRGETFPDTEWSQNFFVSAGISIQF